MTPPRCPRCGARLVQRHTRDTGLPFWGCSQYPRCRGTVSVDAPAPPGTDPWSSQGQALATLQTTLRQVTRERDTLRAGYDQLLAEVRQLRRRPPGTPAAILVRELTRLLSVVHPDKWGGESAVATALTQAVLALRAKLQEGRQ